MSFLELFEFSQRVAHALRRRGIRPGDVVITDLAEELNLVFIEALFHEATISGTYLGPLDASNEFGVDWLIAHEPSRTFPRERTIVVDDDFMNDVAALSATIEPRTYAGMDSVVRLVFSSGTTGTPVAIPYSIDIAEGRSRLADERSNLPRPFMSLVKLAGSIGFRTAYACVASGETYLSPGRVDDNVTLLKENYVAGIQGSPIQLAELVEFLRASGDVLPDVVAVQSVGSALSPQLAAVLRDFFNAPVSVAYGSTEGGFIALRDDVDDDFDDVGRPFPDFDVEIVDGEGHRLSVGETGELRYRGPYTAESYFREELTGRRLRRDGWIYPGDLARRTIDGHLVLMGRTTEVINAGGVKLNPSAIDDFVRRVEGVLDAASFPFEAGLGVDGYAVALVTIDGFDVSSLTGPLTLEFEGCAPRYLVRVNTIRRNAAGKVLRGDMARDLRATLASR